MSKSQETKPEDLFGGSVEKEEEVVDESIKKEEEQEDETSQKKRTEPTWATQLRKDELNLQQLIADSNIEIDEKKTLTLLQVQELYSIAKKEHQNALTNHESEADQFEKEFIEKGTIMDKIASLSLLVQEKPILRLNHIDELITICNHPKNHRAAELAVKTSTDLFQNLLLTHRTLFDFKEREKSNNSSISMSTIYQAVHHFERLNNKKKKKENMQQVGSVLGAWYFEELLKKKYQTFINEVLAENIKERTNALDVVTIRTMRNIRDLIKASPERRDTLIVLLVTKFADPKNSINARALYYLTALVNSRVENNPHLVTSLDKMFLCKSVCEFLLNNKMYASKRGFAASFLTNMTYTPEHDADVADFVLKSCVDVLKGEYLDLVKSQKKKKKEDKTQNLTNTNFLGSLLSGMFKSLKHTKTMFSPDEDTLNLLFKIARITPLLTAVNACKLIYSIAFISNDERTLTRFYTLLYDKLLDEGHTGFKVQNLLLVVYETVREDLNLKRVAAFCKRILQSCFTCSNPGYSAAVLMVIDQILKVKPGLHLSMIQQKNFLTPKKSDGSKDMEDDEEEAFEDFDDEEEAEAKKVETRVLSTKDESVKIVGNEIVIDGFAPKKTSEGSEKQVDSKKKTVASQKARGTNPFTESSDYDPTTPKPEAANALTTGLWELNILKHHFHPSVAEFVDHIFSQSGKTLYKGNPIVDFSTTAFIDKMMFKPVSKKAMKEKGSGLFSKSKAAQAAERVIRGASGVNTKDFAELPDELVKADERFFHKFMVEKFKRKDELEKEREAREEKKKLSKGREEEFLAAMDDNFSDDEDPFNEMDDEQVMELLQQQESDDEDTMPGETEGYGFDITTVSDKANRDEVAQLMDDDEDELLQQEKEELQREKNPEQGNKKRKQKPTTKAPAQNKNKKQKRNK